MYYSFQHGDRLLTLKRLNLTPRPISQGAPEIPCEFSDESKPFI